MYEINITKRLFGSTLDYYKIRLYNLMAHDNIRFDSQLRWYNVVSILLYILRSNYYYFSLNSQAPMVPEIILNITFKQL